MKEWALSFWDEHGNRLTFGAMAFALALFMHYILKLTEQAEVIFVGLAMAFFNQMRKGLNGTTPMPKPEPEKPDKKEDSS